MKLLNYKPKLSEQCLCRSGKKYGECCWRRLPGFDIGKRYVEAIKDRNFSRALLLCRADVTQYTIWHKSHTAPIMFAEQSTYMLRVDVNALGEYIERLLQIYTSLDRSGEILHLIDALRLNIQHPWWQRKIAYFRSLYFLQIMDDVEVARAELAKAGGINFQEDDIDVLQLHIQLNGDGRPLTERIALLDRVLAITKSNRDRLQYRGAKAIQYFLMNENGDAKRILEDAVNFGKDQEAKGKLDPEALVLLARLIQLLGAITSDISIIETAIQRFNDLLLDDSWSAEGRANILREVGDSYKNLEKGRQAEIAYRDALSVTPDEELLKVFIAEALLLQNRVVEAASVIDEVDQNRLEQIGKVDFAFAYGSIAIKSSDSARTGVAKQFLAHLDPGATIFKTRKLELLVSLADQLAAPPDSPATPHKRTSFRDWLLDAADIFEVKPNIMGFGVNFNALLLKVLNREQ